MSRLIDSDKLIDKLKEYTRTNNVEFNGACRSIIEVVKEQPTAFDVDKIEKELRSLKQYDNKYDSYYDNSMYMMTDFQNETVNRTIDKVLEIFRRGGIDENRNI